MPSEVCRNIVLIIGSSNQENRRAKSNLAKKREQMKTMKMPELSEHAESSEECDLPAGSSTANGTGILPASPSSRKSSSSLQPGDTEDSSVDGSSGEKVIRPPSPCDGPVTPSIPDAFLKQLGLSSEEKEPGTELVNGEQSVEQLPDKQLESRFNSLALAFRTDRLTLDKRLKVQERSRDVAEQNIDKELKGLRDAVDALKEVCEEDAVQEMAGKIHGHLDVLEQSVARVSSRAEVFGAVQQEKRMCLAMEVMVTFTENIRRLRSTEQNEVEEARKVLNSSRQFNTNFSLDTLSIGDRRSASVCAALSNPRTARRRSEVALPRFFGGAGSPLHVTSSMEPRQRFQSATANVTVRNVVTNTLRRASMDRQRTTPQPLPPSSSSSVTTTSTTSSSSTSSTPSAAAVAAVAAFSSPSISISSSSTTSSSSAQQPSSSSRSNSADTPQDQATKDNSQEEEAYRHGYEEGLKASLGRELTELRDQQTSISSNLEQVMDRVDAFHDDNDQSDLEEAVSQARAVAGKVRQWVSSPPNWQSASHTLRKAAAALMFLAALGVILVTFAPLFPSNLSIRNHGQNSQ